jgi:hypothetical protein
MDKELPRVGDRLSTPTGDWQVKEVVVLGRAPLHYAVRAAHTDAAGIRHTVTLSAAEFRALQARAKPPPRAARRR